MNKSSIEKYELKLSELELILDNIIFSIDWLLEEMEGLRRNKEEAKVMQINILHFNDALIEILEDGNKIIKGYGEIYYDY